MSGEDEALKRIAAAARSGADTLDLSRLGLTTLPPEIWQLSGLKRKLAWAPLGDDSSRELPAPAHLP